MSDPVFENGHALIIGVGSDLPMTVSDANAVGALLIDSNIAAYPAEQVTILTQERATRQNIITALSTLCETVNSRPESTVVIYYSGHGGRVIQEGSTSEYFLVPFGYDPARRMETAVSGAEFTRLIESVAARKLVVFLDCCHAGGIPLVKGIRAEFIKAPLPPEMLTALDSGSGRVIITSSRDNEISFGGTPYSLFTACLLEALSGKASVAKDGLVRILDILIYLFEQVPKRSGDQQHPFVKKVLDLRDNFSVCYYAGGDYVGQAGTNLEAKEGQGSLPKTHTARQRRKQKLGVLQRDWDRRIVKIERMRHALAIEAGFSVRYQLEQELLREEVVLAGLGEDIDKLQNQLS